MKEKKKFSGLIVPVLTPVKEDGTLDEKGFRMHLEEQIARGVNGLYVAGTNGEAGQLPYGTWKEANRVALDVARGSATRVYCGAVAPGTLETIERIKVLEEMGADTVFATPAFYVTSNPQEQIYLHFEKISKATSVDLVIYNIPFAIQTDISNETLVRLAQLPNVIGVKDTRDDWGTHMKNLRALRDTKVAVACVPEPFIAASLMLGADGIVTALGNFLPEPYLMAIDAADRDDRSALMEAFDEIMAFDEILKCPNGNWIAFCKYLLNQLIGSSPYTALTTVPITPEQREVAAKAKEYILRKKVELRAKMEA